MVSFPNEGIEFTLKEAKVLDRDEPPTVIRLEGGGEMRVRAIVNRVLKVIGPDGEQAVDQKGKLVFQLDANMNVTYVPVEEL